MDSKCRIRVYRSLQKWLRKQFGFVSFELDLVTSKIFRYCNNNGAIASAMEPQSHQRSKHILRRCRMIKVIISVKWCESKKNATDDNVAEPLIRCYARAKFKHHLESMGIRYMGDWLLVKWEIVGDMSWSISFIKLKFTYANLIQ